MHRGARALGQATEAAGTNGMGGAQATGISGMSLQLCRM